MFSMFFSSMFSMLGYSSHGGFSVTASQRPEEENITEYHKIGPSGAVQTVSDSRRPLFLVIGPSGAVQTVSDSRRPLFLVINLLLVGGAVPQNPIRVYHRVSNFCMGS